MKKVLLLIMIALVGCKSNREEVKTKYEQLIAQSLEKAGDRKEIMDNLLKNAPDDRYEATAFLIAYMPEKDLKTLSSEFISNQIDMAYKVKEEFAWCQSLPDSIFFNEVLPYYCFDEDRDNWRDDFYNKFSPIVKQCKTVNEAIDSINKNIQPVLLVDYNTKRSKVNISPFQAIKEKMATCTGLSILLVDAFRSVGIPARIAGTPMWTNMRGNHSWVEVWIDGKWYFTEYYPDKLNKSWFLADAGKADITKPIHWVYASSYKPKDTYFPLVWDSLSQEIHAENVTQRYIDLYDSQRATEELKPDETWLEVVLYDTNSKDKTRIVGRIAVLEKGKEVDFGYSTSKTDDLNRFLRFKLKKNTTYELLYKDSKGADIKEKILTPTIDSSCIIGLYN